MRPGYNTTSVTIRVPGVILSEIKKRALAGQGQTAVILDALCHAFEIANPRARKETGDKHGHGRAPSTADGISQESREG